MDEPAPLVALGGTFDPIHDGHRALFDRACSLGHVTIGLTSDSLATEFRAIDRPVRPYEERLRRLDEAVRPLATAAGRHYEIRKLTDPLGIADEPRFSVLVVSPETEPAGRQINEQRREADLAPLEIDVVDHVRADDGDIISSTRIVQGEIDEHGNVLE